MLYTIYDWWQLGSLATSAAAETWATALRGLAEVVPEAPPTRAMRLACETVASTGISHAHPGFGIRPVQVDGRWREVEEDAVQVTAFCTLRRFAVASDTPRPRVLLAAPLAGHFASLLRPTVQSLVADHDVYLTDWHNARDVPMDAGRFGLEEYIGYVVDTISMLGPGIHVVAVCQPCVPALAATAVLAARDDAVQPASLTLIAGPIDGRVQPTAVNDLATDRPLEWFERHLIATVPSTYAGRGRRVYPGFLQLGGFLSLDPWRHVQAQATRYVNLLRGEQDAADATAAFYHEYLSVMDLPAEFYLETVGAVFQRCDLAQGRLSFGGEPVRPEAIRHTPLLTIEGANDNLCAPGQTAAAHRLCSGLAEADHHHHLQEGVGHYGVFGGRHWREGIYPRLRHFVAEADERARAGSA